MLCSCVFMFETESVFARKGQKSITLRKQNAPKRRGKLSELATRAFLYCTYIRSSSPRNGRVLASFCKKIALDDLVNINPLFLKMWGEYKQSGQEMQEKFCEEPASIFLSCRLVILTIFSI